MSRASVALCCAAQLIAPARAQDATAPASEHGLEYWRAIAASGYALPAGESALDLLLELSTCFGSASTELRDDLGYGISADWILRQQLLDEVDRNVLALEWSRNLRRGLAGGEESAEDVGAERDLDREVLFRSFSALGLSLLAASDLQRPFLDQEGFDDLLTAALGYLRAETDLRGWVESLGWVHATAHTADLLKLLARNPRLERARQGEILQAIAQRLASTGSVVFVHGEQERLARVVIALLAREDFEVGGYGAFLESLVGVHARRRAGGGFDPEVFAAEENVRQLVRCVIVALDGGGELSERLEGVRRDSLGVMARL